MSDQYSYSADALLKHIDCLWDGEEWREAPGLEGRYRVSSLGRVLNQRDSRITTGHIDRFGYARLSVQRSGRCPAKLAVHRLVCAAFHGPAPSATSHVRHLDGNPTNNAATNLRWGTAKENHEDMLRHGTRRRGETHPRATVTEADVIKIRALAKAGGRPCDLARQFGSTRSAVAQIIAGTSWRHV